MKRLFHFLLFLLCCSVVFGGGLTTSGGISTVGGTGNDPTKLPLAGGTLTGPLGGTVATFTGAVDVGNLTIVGAQVASSAPLTGHIASSTGVHGLPAGESVVGSSGSQIASTAFRSNLGIANHNTITVDASGNATFPGQIEMAGASMTQNLVLNLRWLSGDGGNEGIFVNSLGNVGIGTVNPSVKLGFPIAIGEKIRFYDDGNSAYSIGVQANELRLAGGISAGDFIAFRTQGYNAGSERVRIAGNGNVGIGTTNPTTAKLVVATNAGAEGLDLATADSYANLRVIRNSLNASNKDMHLGLGSGATSTLHLYSNNAKTLTLEGGLASFSGGIKMNSGADTVASTALVTQLRSDANASNTLALAFTTDSVSTHAALISSHGSTTIASKTYVDQAIATAVAAIPGAGVSGDPYRLAAPSASEAIYLNGTGLSIAVASGSIINIVADFAAVASGTGSKWAGELRAWAIASGTTAYIAESVVKTYAGENRGALGITAGISAGNLQIYASGPASLWKIHSLRSFELEDEP